MSVQSRTKTNLSGVDLGGARTTSLRHDFQQPSLPQQNPVNFDFDNGTANEAQNTTGKRAVPDWIARSSLRRLEKPGSDIEPVCFFEPLNYCVRGKLINGFCDFHRHYMFNVEMAETSMLVQGVRDLVIVTTPRRLIRFPTPLQTSFIRMFPVAELCDNVEEFEKNLNLSLFFHNLMFKEPRNPKKLEKVETIVKEHKAYIMRVMRMYTPNETTTQIEDSKINQYMEMWLKSCSRDLNSMPFNIKLIYLSDTAEPIDNDDGTSNAANMGQLRWFALQECSVLTQMIALLYESPYVVSRSLNNACLSVPCAMLIFEREHKSIALDCSKAAHGTVLSGESPCYGDPATLSMLRGDNNENITFVRDHYNPNRQICFKNKLDTKALLRNMQAEE